MPTPFDRKRTVDGDTWTQKGGRNVRLEGADAPEMTFGKLQPGALPARDMAERYTQDGTKLTTDPDGAYGRENAEIYDRDGRSLSYELARQGLATPFDDNAGAAAGRLARLQQQNDALSQWDTGFRTRDDLDGERGRMARIRRLAAVAQGDRDAFIHGSQIRLPHPDSADGIASRAWERGLGQGQNAIYGTAHALGNLFESEVLKDWGAEGLHEAFMRGIEHPAEIGSLDDVEGLAEFALYMGERIIEEMPMVAVDVAAALATAGTAAGATATLRLARVGKTLARATGGAAGVSTISNIGRAARIGANVGAGASMFLQGTGNTQADLFAHGVEDHGAQTLAIGALSSAINLGAFHVISGLVVDSIRRGMPVEEAAALFSTRLSDLSKQVGHNTLTGSAVEALAGAGDSLVAELNRVASIDGYEFNPTNILEGVLVGTGVGGTMAGGGTAIGGSIGLLGGADRDAGGNEPVDEGTLPEAPTDEVAPKRTWTTPESPEGLAAQDNAEDGATQPPLREQEPGLQERELADDSVQVVQTAEALAEVPVDPDEADQAATLSHVQSEDEVAAAAEAGEQVLVVQEQDAEGNDLRSQLVSESRVEDAVAQAEAAGRPAVVMTPEEAQQRRADQLAALGVDVAQMPDATQTVEPDNLPPAAIRFEESAPLADIGPLAQEAGALGIDPRRFVRTEPTVDADVLRRELASRMGETLAEDANRTLRDALGGRHLSELDVDQLRQLARAMGMRDLPRPLKAVKRGRERFRQSAAAAINRKLNEWRRGMRQDTDGKWLASRAPSDVSLMSQLFPELAGLSRGNFPNTREGTAQYQQAVRQAIPDAPAVLQRLNQMSDAELYQATQLTRADFTAPEGVELEFGDEERVDVGRLKRAVAEHRPQGEGGSYNTDADAQGRSEARMLEREASPEEGGPVGDPFLANDAAHAAAVAAAYAELTGMTDGPGVRQVVEAQRGILDDDQAAAVRATAMDGKRLVRRVIGDEDAGRREWEQLAMTSPAAFAREFGAALVDTNTPLDAFVASRDTQERPHTESGEPTAQGTADRGLVESREPDWLRDEAGNIPRTEDGEPILEPAGMGGMDYTGIETGNEQESSDRLFFISLLEGARFGRDSEGGVHPAGPLRPESEGSLHRQRVTSSERTQRLEGKNLGSLTVRNRQGTEEPWLFDMAALAGHGRGDGGRPANAVEAYRNLLNNLSRMVRGPESAAHLPDGENPSYVQTLRSDFAVNEPVVIFEDADGNAVTFGEARDAHYRALADTTEATLLADEADRLREIQGERRKAMRVLISRALNGLDALEGEKRLATILAINDAMYQAYDGDQLVAESERVASRLSASEKAALHEELAKRQAKLEQTLADQAEALPQIEAALERAKNNVASTQRYIDSMHNLSGEATLELAAFEVVEATRQRRFITDTITEAEQQLADVVRQREALPPRMEHEAVDLRGVNRYLANLSRFRLTDVERERHGIGDTGGLENLETLRTQYRRTREQLKSMTDALERFTEQYERLPSDADPQVDSLARAFLNEGMDRDEAYALATELAEKVDGVTRKEDASSLSLDEDGDPSDPDFEGATPDESATERAWQEAQKPIKQRDEQLAAKVEAFKAMHADNPQVNMAEPTPEQTFQLYEGFTLPAGLQGVGRSRFSPGSPAARLGRDLRVDPSASPAHAASREQQAAARRVQGAGIPLPETPRAKILDAVFKDEGFKVVGAFDEGAVGDFVAQALNDFRSTDRPVLVMAGEDAVSISRFIEANQLLRPNQRKRAARALADAEAGRQPLYMPMGDFVLVAMPTQPNTKRQSANLRWYHQLGHELGHLVFDDYAQSLAGNRTLRERVYTSFTAETGLEPRQDESLFKEWFADKAANEMISQAFGRADPEQVTPFTRLATLMQGLWERIQHLLPRMTRSRSFAQFAEAIRQGQIAKNRLAATPDFTAEHYEGNALEGARLKQSATKLKAGIKRATAKGTAMEAASRSFRTVVGRLESYHPELAKRMFQRSASDRSTKGVAAWQQMANNSRDRWVGAMERAFRVIGAAAGAKDKKAREAALVQAFRDLEARRRTQGAAALATLIDGVIANARENGLRSVIHRDDFVPTAINHEAVDSRREEFTVLLKETFPGESDTQLRQRLEVLLDTNGYSDYAIAPGLPVSTHDTSSKLNEVIGTARLREMGFLNEHSDAVLYHWIEGMAKRTAWEANFGGYTREVDSPLLEHQRVLGVDDPQGNRMRELGLMNEEGLYYDPSGEFKQLVAEAVAEHGVAAERDIRDMLDGVMGRTTSRMPRGIRQANDWITAWTSWTVLLFSGIASIPELGLPMVRAHGRVGVFDGLKGVAEARRLAKDMGVVLSDGAERIIWQSMGDAYESSTLNKLGNAFFTLNGQRMMTNATRTLGVSFGIQYLLKSAEVGDTQALTQLGVNAAEVRAWDAAGRQAWQPGINSADNAIAEKVNAAINQFVYEGSSMPSKLQNPSWFNNPYLKMFWMIKRYMYAYGEGILMGMWRQGKRQWMRGAGLSSEQRVFLAVAPALTFAIATIPLAAAGTELRELLRPYTTGRPGKEVKDYGGARQYGEYLFSRAGGYGPLEALLSMRQQSEWGYSPLGSVSPVIGKMEMLMDWGSDGQLSSDEALTKLRQLIPVFSQMPRAWNAGLDAITR